MSAFTKIPSDTFKKLQMNAGILASAFTPATGTLDDTDIIGATSGGVAFAAVPSFTDFGEDIDNCPKNTMELKKLTSWEVILSGALLAVFCVGAGVLAAKIFRFGTLMYGNPIKFTTALKKIREK